MVSARSSRHTETVKLIRFLVNRPIYNYAIKGGFPNDNGGNPDLGSSSRFILGVRWLTSPPRS